MKNTRPLKVMFTTAALAAALTGCGSDSDSGSGDGGQGAVDTNAAPVITSTAVVSVLENAAYEYTLVATDADADELVYSATTLPAGFAFDAATGVLSSADVGAAASHDVVLSVTDGEDSTTDTFTITVEIDDGSVFTVFKDSVVGGWAVWGEGGQLPVLATDADAAYGEVVEFANFGDGNFAEGQTVNGFSASALKQGNGISFDASAYRAEGSIQFDIKMTAAPALTDTWYFKVESSSGQNGGQEFVIDTPVLNEWVHYVVPLSLVSAANAADLINLMVFPAWGDNEGARFSMDNLQIFPTTPYLDEREPLAGDVVLFDETLAAGWAIWQDSNGELVDNTIALLQDEELGAVIGLTSIGTEVAGITTRSQKINGLPDTPLDASAFAGGTLHFDMKLTAETAAPFDTWFVKLEGVGAGQTSIPAPVLGEWMHYSVDLAAFGDLTAINNIMIFPAWDANAAGAAYSVDNITFSTEAPPIVYEAVDDAYIFESANDASYAFEHVRANWDTNAVIIDSTDTTYAKALEITKGDDGWGTVVAWGNEVATNFDIAAYTHVKFKVQTTDFTAVNVFVQSATLPQSEVSAELSTGVDLGNGWVEMTVALPDFTDFTWLALNFGRDGTTALVADVYFTQVD